MKKTIVFLLLTAMLLTAMLPMTAVATEPKDYSENLVGYWDFAKYNRPLWDKAPGGSESNDLTVPSGVAKNLGSAAIISNTAGDYYTMSAQTGKDIGQSAGLTIGFKLKLDQVENSTSNTILVHRANAYQIRARYKSATTYSIEWINDALPNRVYCICNVFGDTTFQYGTEYFVFISVSADTATDAKGNTVPVNDIVGYYSTDGKSFTASAVNENVEHHYSATYVTTAMVESGYVFRYGASKAISFIGKGSATDVAGAAVTLDTLWYFNAAVEGASLPNVVRKTHYATDNTAVEVPTYRGLQLSPVTKNTDGNLVFGTRLIATVDSLDYAEVGFEVKVKSYNGQSSAVATPYVTNEVFTSLMGGEDGVGDGVIYTAEDLGGEYIYAVTIGNIPTDAAVTFEVSVYYKTLDGEAQIGDTYTITVDNGRFVSQALVTA